ncbi:hypothetical protein GCWB2_02395 [Gordonia rubripertincta]|nr:hypothetical protein GCWB2_02395 [Gordonia rubripertincta]
MFVYRAPSPGSDEATVAMISNAGITGSVLTR